MNHKNSIKDIHVVIIETPAVFDVVIFEIPAVFDVVIFEIPAVFDTISPCSKSLSRIGEIMTMLCLFAIYRKNKYFLAIATMIGTT